MEKELVSVVITTYKRRVSQIKAAIDSVLNQSHENLELIIVDDSPNEYEYRDEVKNYCENISDSRVKYIQHEKIWVLVQLEIQDSLIATASISLFLMTMMNG